MLERETRIAQRAEVHGTLGNAFVKSGTASARVAFVAQ